MTHSDKGKQLLNQVVELFTTEGCPIVNFSAKGLLTMGDRPSAKWSIGNRILMLAQGTTDARGYQQWLQVGRQVKKGSKAIYILRPLIMKVKEIDPVTKVEREKEFVHGFAGLPVFRIEDTDITDAAKWESSFKSDVPKQLPPLADVAQAWGIKVVYDATREGEYGSYSQYSETIRLCTADESTFFHELAHAADKKLKGKLKGGQDTEQEIIAELSSAVLARCYNLNVDAAAYTYIASYVKSAKPKDIGVWCIRVLGQVEKVISLILDTKTALDEKLVTVPA